MQRYDHVPPEEADVVVGLGGDGLMLQALHRFMGTAKPIYGMNRGTVGFLMNEFKVDGLKERLAVAQGAQLHPLRMTAENNYGGRQEALLDALEVRLLKCLRPAPFLESHNIILSLPLEETQCF